MTAVIYNQPTNHKFIFSVDDKTYTLEGGVPVELPDNVAKAAIDKSHGLVAEFDAEQVIAPLEAKTKAELAAEVAERTGEKPPTSLRKADLLDKLTPEVEPLAPTQPVELTQPADGGEDNQTAQEGDK